MCNVYLLCKEGETLMPCSFNGFDDSGLALVISPNGTEYTAAPHNLISLEDAAEMLRQRRADKLVAAGYLIMHLRGDRYRVWLPKRHGTTGGYQVTLGDNPACTCPDFEKRGAACKHILGAPDLLRYAQVQKPTVRVMALGVRVGRPERIPLPNMPAGSYIEVSADYLEAKVNARAAARKAAVTA